MLGTHNSTTRDLPQKKRIGGRNIILQGQRKNMDFVIRKERINRLIEMEYFFNSEFNNQIHNSEGPSERLFPKGEEITTCFMGGNVRRVSWEECYDIIGN